MRQTDSEWGREVGARGKARRQELGRSVREIAELLEVSTQRVHEMEQIGVQHLVAIRQWSSALNMPMAKLAFGSVPPHQQAVLCAELLREGAANIDTRTKPRKALATRMLAAAKNILDV